MILNDNYNLFITSILLHILKVYIYYAIFDFNNLSLNCIVIFSNFISHTVLEIIVSYINYI